MSGKILLEPSCPVTQTAEAVKQLIEFVTHKPCEELPESFSMPSMVLVLSNKKDVYYVVTEKDCSCPARTYNPGKHCKHMRKHYPQKVKSQSMADVLDGIRPTAKWVGGHNGPVSDLQEDMKAQGYEMSFEADW